VKNHPIFKNFYTITLCNQADAPLLLESFPKRPRTPEASQFGGFHKYKTNQTNYLPSYIDVKTMKKIGSLFVMCHCGLVGAQNPSYVKCT